MKLEKKWQKMTPKATLAHIVAFPEVSKPEIGTREDRQLTAVKQPIHRSLDLYEGEFRKGGVLNRGASYPQLPYVRKSGY